jgi:hypothetical protein
MTSTLVLSSKLSDALYLPAIEWPDVSIIPLKIDWPIIPEDTVECDIQEL